MYTLLWFAFAIILIVVEAFTLSFGAIWFAIGSLAAFLVSFYTASIVLECVVFLLVSLLSMFLTRPLVMKYMKKKQAKTNYEKFIGRTVVITEEVNNLAATGKAECDGVDWSVKSKNDQDIIEEGKLVKVVDIEGVKFVVEEI